MAVTIMSDIVGRLFLGPAEFGMIGRWSRGLVGTIGLKALVIRGSVERTVVVPLELSVGTKAGSPMVNIGLGFFLELVWPDSLGVCDVCLTELFERRVGIGLDGSAGNKTCARRAVEDLTRELKADGVLVIISAGKIGAA